MSHSENIRDLSPTRCGEDESNPTLAQPLFDKKNLVDVFETF